MNQIIQFCSVRNFINLFLLIIVIEVTFKIFTNTITQRNEQNANVLRVKFVRLKVTNETEIRNQQITINKKFHLWKKQILEEKGLWNFRNFSDEELSKLSNLGRRLFLHEDVGVPKNETYLIYVYKFGQRLSARFINHYTKSEHDPFQNCAVNNCRISVSHEDFEKADSVLFHLHLLPGPPTELNRTNFDQRWVWLSDESIFNTFMVAKDKDLNHYNNIFNWSMTYRADSDVPVPYGRTIPLLDKSHIDKSYLDIFDKKNKTLAIMLSSCSNRNGRWKYVKELQKYIQVDVYGGCGPFKCKGHFKQDCPLLNSYKFYLAFENSNCKDYITEKAWWNALKKKAVPVVLGTNKSNYEKMLPPNSFIHVEDFDSPQHLAQYIIFLSKNKDDYNKFHAWRTNFKVVNEHGYFQTNVYHYCRLCEALNFNSLLPNTYNSMQTFWNVSHHCNTINFANKRENK